MPDAASFDRGVLVGRRDAIHWIKRADGAMVDPLPRHVPYRFGGVDLHGDGFRLTLFVLPRDAVDLRHTLHRLDESPTLLASDGQLVTLQVRHPFGVYVLCCWVDDCDYAGLNLQDIDTEST